MNEIQKEQELTFKEALAQAGVPVEIEGVAVQCVMPSGSGNSDLEDGGVVVDGTISPRFLVADLPDPMPGELATIRVGDRVYVVQHYFRKPGSAIVQYEAERP